MTEATQVDIAKAELELIKSKIAVLEAAASTDWVKVKTAIKANVPHYVTWAGLAAVGGHLAGLFKLWSALDDLHAAEAALAAAIEAAKVAEAPVAAVVVGPAVVVAPGATTSLGLGFIGQPPVEGLDF